MWFREASAPCRSTCFPRYQVHTPRPLCPAGHPASSHLKVYLFRRCGCQRRIDAALLVASLPYKAQKQVLRLEPLRAAPRDPNGPDAPSLGDQPRSPVLTFKWCGPFHPLPRHGGTWPIYVTGGSNRGEEPVFACCPSAHPRMPCLGVASPSRVPPWFASRPGRVLAARRRKLPRS